MISDKKKACPRGCENLLTFIKSIESNGGFWARRAYLHVTPDLHIKGEVVNQRPIRNTHRRNWDIRVHSNHYVVFSTYEYLWVLIMYQILFRYYVQTCLVTHFSNRLCSYIKIKNVKAHKLWRKLCSWVLFLPWKLEIIGVLPVALRWKCTRLPNKWLNIAHIQIFGYVVEPHQRKVIISLLLQHSRFPAHQTSGVFSDSEAAGRRRRGR